MYPVWLRFQGGKGVATGAGAFLPLAPVATAVAFLAFALSAALTRYVSLGSIVGTLTLPVAAFLQGAPPSVTAWAAAIGLLVVWKHRANLERLFRGTERRVGSARQ
jgi:glycerol-3-phosphate acyltransferase PlsY